MIVFTEGVLGMSRIQIPLPCFRDTDPLPSLPAGVQVAETQAPGCLAADQDTDDIIASCLYGISLPGWPHVTLTQLGHAMRGPVSKACTVIVNTAITDVKIPPIFLGWPWADFSLSRELVASQETAKTEHAQRNYFQCNQNSNLHCALAHFILIAEST